MNNLHPNIIDKIYETLSEQDDTETKLTIAMIDNAPMAIILPLYMKYKRLASNIRHYLTETNTCPYCEDIINGKEKVESNT